MGLLYCTSHVTLTTILQGEIGFFCGNWGGGWPHSNSTNPEVSASVPHAFIHDQRLSEASFFLFFLKANGIFLSWWGTSLGTQAISLTYHKIVHKMELDMNLSCEDSCHRWGTYLGLLDLPWTWCVLRTITYCYPCRPTFEFKRLQPVGIPPFWSPRVRQPQLSGFNLRFKDCNILFIILYIHCISTWNLSRLV